MMGAGGTGGHVYPALSAAEVLSQQNDHTLFFVGTRGGGGFERRLVEEAGIQFAAIDEVFAGPIVGVNPLRALTSLVLMTLGTLQALGLLMRHQPGAILLTGGWANVPLALAAWLLRVPMLVYLPDIEPGSTIKLLARFAKKVAITVPDSAQYFRAGQTIVTGYPLRHAVRAATRAAAITQFQLDLSRKTLLVFGGSRGARSINIALTHILPDLLQEQIQILHVTGTLDYERVQTELAAIPDKMHYHSYAYLDDTMGAALAAADMVLSRAGASVLGEFPFFGLPAILVPYPYAWRYQKTNADYLAARGAAVRLDDEKMATELLPLLRDWLHHPTKLSAMSAAAKALAQPQGAQQLAQVLVDLAEKKRL